jgi:hypothetical protein
VLAVLLTLLFVQPDTPALAVGEFTNMRFSEEHAHGYSVQLWRAGDELFGLFMAANGLAGDTPTGRLQRVRFDPAANTVVFDARLPVHGYVAFSGVLSAGELAGEVTRRSPRAASRVVLRRLPDKPPDFASFMKWDEMARLTLSHRGPKPLAIDRLLAPHLEVQEASIPDGWTLPRPMPAREAIGAAVEALESRGVTQITICRLEWIVAPLGAAIVLATGRWQTAGASFFAFSVGIHDGTEVRYGDPAGKEFMFLSRGTDSRHREVYFDGAQVRQASELVEPLDELLFEFTSREVLGGLRERCGKP